jgi:thiosulfate dehydrogenase [quinone] large subunit
VSDAGRGSGERRRPGSALLEHAASKPGILLLPLRLFLGATFLYAGLYKLFDQRFFEAKAPTSIQSYLHLYARQSPIEPLVALAAHAPVAIGLAIAFGEVAVGTGTLLGFLPRIAALGGMVLALCFFLTVSFHDHPYFYGSDIVFFFAWSPLAIVGDGGVLSLERRIRRRAKRELGLSADVADAELSAEGRAQVDRRTFLHRSATGVVVAMGALGLSGVASFVGKAFGHGFEPLQALGKVGLLGESTAAKGTEPGAEGSRAAPAITSSTPIPNGSIGVGSSAAVPVLGAVGFLNPFDDSPCYAVRPEEGDIKAFSAICTHMGCVVAFVGSDKTFQCPCHGSIFEAFTGKVVQGPATVPLPEIPLALGEHGEVYVVPPKNAAQAARERL